MKQQGERRILFCLFVFFENRKVLVVFREEKKKVFLFLENAIISRLQEEYKYHKGKDFGCRAGWYLFLIIMVSAGVAGSAPIHSSKLPSHKYITALLASITTSLTFSSTKKTFLTKAFPTFQLDMFVSFPLIYVCGTASRFLISFRTKAE